MVLFSKDSLFFSFYDKITLYHQTKLKILIKLYNKIMFYREITLFHFHLYTHSSAISKVSLRPVSNEPNINLESFDANREIEYLQLLVSCASLDAGRVLAVTQKVQKLFEMFFMFWPGMFLHSPKHAKCV